MRNWEIFNRPGKGKLLPYTFFALWYESGDEKAAKVLEAPFNKPYLQYGHTLEWAAEGFMPWYVPGIPRMRGASLRGEYPFALVEFKDNSPLRISLTAFAPVYKNLPEYPTACYGDEFCCRLYDPRRGRGKAGKLKADFQHNLKDEIQNGFGTQR